MQYYEIYNYGTKEINTLMKDYNVCDGYHTFKIFFRIQIRDKLYSINVD